MKMFLTLCEWDDSPVVLGEDELEGTGVDNDTGATGFPLLDALMKLEVAQSLHYHFPFNGNQTWVRLQDDTTLAKAINGRPKEF